MGDADFHTYTLHQFLQIFLENKVVGTVAAATVAQ